MNIRTQLILFHSVIFKLFFRLMQEVANQVEEREKRKETDNEIA